MITGNKDTNTVAGIVVVGTILVLALPHLMALLAVGYVAQKYVTRDRNEDSNYDSQ